MRREDLKALGLDDTQIDAVMKQHGADIQAEQAKINEATTKLNEANEALKKFDGIDVEALNATIKQLQDEKADYLFKGAVKDAITAAGGRSVKAISALLDLDALRGTKEGQTEAIAKAVEDAKAANAWAFKTAETKPEKTITTVDTGDEHGEGGNGSEVSEVERLFLAQNPGLKV